MVLANHMYMHTYPMAVPYWPEKDQQLVENEYENEYSRGICCMFMCVMCR